MSLVLLVVFHLSPLVTLYMSVFFNGTAPTEIYTYLHTLSLHDALPISGQGWKDDLGLHIQRTIRRGAACRPVCSVPASQRPHSGSANFEDKKPGRERSMPASKIEIGRASCRERVCQNV